MALKALQVSSNLARPSTYSFGPSSPSYQPKLAPRLDARIAAKKHLKSSTSIRKCRANLHGCMDKVVQSQKDQTTEIPIVLYPSVIFPGATLQLQAFEFRYRIMMQTLLQEGLKFGKNPIPPRLPPLPRRAMAPASLPVSVPCAPGASRPLLASPGPSVVAAASHLLASSRSTGHRVPGALALAAAAAPGGRQGRGSWRTGVSSFSFLPRFLTGKGEKDAEKAERLKEELLAAIAPLDRGAEATPEDKERVEQIGQQLEAVNPTKEPLKSDLLNGKWELLYTTSTTILQPNRPKFLRSFGKIYQAINTDTLRAQNMETWPYFNQVTANLVPLNSKRVAVKFDYFKIFSLIRIKSPGSGKGELEIMYLDEELRVSRGDKGNLFVLKMVDPTYRVPL